MIRATLGRSERVAELQADVAAALSAGADELAAHAEETIMVGSYYADSLYIQGEQSSVTNLSASSASRSPRPPTSRWTSSRWRTSPRSPRRTS